MPQSPVVPKRFRTRLHLLHLLQLSTRVFLRQLQTGHWVQQLQHLGQVLLGDKSVSGHALHPCFIKHQPTLVHAPDLDLRDSDFFYQLQQFARHQNYQLLADRRCKDVAVSHERRSRQLPVLVLSMGLGAATAVADQAEPARQTLALFDARLEHTHQHDDLTAVESALKQLDTIEDLQPDAGHTELATELTAILLQHYRSTADAPAYVLEDLAAMGDYFAGYPQATALLRALRGQAWQLDYSSDTFETQVRGNRIQVQGATVKFDSRAAAQLRNHKACLSKPGACIASPADALLHELLHVESALLNSSEFIAQGGLNSVIYPFAHEDAVIHRENALYKAMSEVDGRYRPHRHVHAGRVVASACVTCLQ